MEINPEKMSTEMETLIYEQPSLKKYGTMKQLTLATKGSGGDSFSKQGSFTNDIPSDIDQGIVKSDKNSETMLGDTVSDLDEGNSPRNLDTRSD